MGEAMLEKAHKPKNSAPTKGSVNSVMPKGPVFFLKPPGVSLEKAVFHALTVDQTSTKQPPVQMDSQTSIKNGARDFRS